MEQRAWPVDSAKAPLYRIFKEKLSGASALRTIVMFIAAISSAAVLYLAAGEWGWLLASLLTAGLALLAYLRNEANAQMLDGRQALVSRVSDAIPGMVYQCRLYPTGRCSLVYANDALAWIYEKEFSEVEHDCSSILDLVHPEDRPRVEESLFESALRLTPWKGEYRVVLPRQGMRWRFAQATVERLKDGSTLWSGFVADVTARKEADERLRVLEQKETEALRAARRHERKKLAQLSRLNKSLRVEASHDHLTGVHLRRYFDRRYPEIFEDARMKRSVTVIFCDIDHFKSYNDTFGHLAGDRCLADIARALAAHVNRQGQVFARYGGEEFVAVLPGLSSARAGVVAEDMRRCVEELCISAPTGREDVVTISIGVATMDRVPHDVAHDVLLSVADGALYEAKRKGRNQIRLQVLGTSPTGKPAKSL